MKKNLLSFTLLSACFILMFNMTSCKKATEDVTTLDEVAQSRVQSEDASYMDGESESIDDDANQIMATSERFSGSGNVFATGAFSMPDATFVLPSAAANRILVTFNGTLTRGCRKRTGSLTIDLINGNRWFDVGATIKYTFVNFKVQNTCRNRSITINGERFITNVNGGNIFSLNRGMTDSLVHKVRNGATGLKVTFEDSVSTSTATWFVAKKTVIRHELGNHFYTISGDTTLSSKAKTVRWGTTRFGTNYQTVISNPIKANTYCFLSRPKSGEVVHYVNAITSTTTFGTDAAGNPVSSPNCPDYFKVNVNNGVRSVTTIIPYR